MPNNTNSWGIIPANGRIDSPIRPILPAFGRPILPYAQIIQELSHMSILYTLDHFPKCRKYGAPSPESTFLPCAGWDSPGSESPDPDAALMLRMWREKVFFFQLAHPNECNSLFGHLAWKACGYYRVTQQVWDLIGLTLFDCFTVCPILLGQVKIWQNWQNSWTTWWASKSMSSQPSLKSIVSTSPPMLGHTITMYCVEPTGSANQLFLYRTHRIGCKVWIYHYNVSLFIILGAGIQGQASEEKSHLVLLSN